MRNAPLPLGGDGGPADECTQNDVIHQEMCMPITNFAMQAVRCGDIYVKR